MTLSPAPFFEDMAGGPVGGAAWWCATVDDVRIRVGFWPCEAAKGTVILFPGRTEYIEKYGRTAAALSSRGYATLAIDWRGQGLADRLIEDRRVGHVIEFTDYQHDVAAALDVARELGAPEPWFLLGHSMGGGIGLRSALEGMPVAACAFTGPMWGIAMAPAVRPFGMLLPRVAALLGMGTRLAPSTRYEPYVLLSPFQDNTLTTDEDMYRMMQTQLATEPGLSLGGPSMIWLRESLQECRYLSRQASPDIPCVTFVGGNERIIDTSAVHDRMNRWDGGELQVIPGAQHEVLMEKPAIRNRVLDRMDELFSQRTRSPAPPKTA